MVAKGFPEVATWAYFNGGELLVSSVSRPFCCEIGGKGSVVESGSIRLAIVESRARSGRRYVGGRTAVCHGTSRTDLTILRENMLLLIQVRWLYGKIETMQYENSESKETSLTHCRIQCNFSSKYFT